MNAKLFRDGAEIRDDDLSWSHVGPSHERASFCLIEIAGYAPAQSLGDTKPPFHIYSMAGEKVHGLRATVYQTIPAAKRAARAWVKGWLTRAASTVTWEASDSGHHFYAKVECITVANYYYCPEAKGEWPKGFLVWFGGTYYMPEFADPDEARVAVDETYSRWLNHARACLL